MKGGPGRPRGVQNHRLSTMRMKVLMLKLQQPRISALEVSNRLDVPLSTIQRYSKFLDTEVMVKSYELNYAVFGGLRKLDAAITYELHDMRSVDTPLLLKLTESDPRVYSMRKVGRLGETALMVSLLVDMEREGMAALGEALNRVRHAMRDHGLVPTSTTVYEQPPSAEVATNLQNVQTVLQKYVGYPVEPEDQQP